MNTGQKDKNQDTPKILVVEDSIFIAKIVQILLKKEKMEVIHESDGSKALDTAKKNSVHLVILDLMMPGVTGKDVFSCLKKDKATKDIPVVIMTAVVDALERDPELKQCDAFMTKPYDNKELVDTVKKLLSRKK